MVTAIRVTWTYDDFYTLMIMEERGLDPDGDGFACSWDPSPFRNAVQ